MRCVLFSTTKICKLFCTLQYIVLKFCRLFSHLIYKRFRHVFLPRLLRGGDARRWVGCSFGCRVGRSFGCSVGFMQASEVSAVRQASDGFSVGFRPGARTGCDGRSNTVLSGLRRAVAPASGGVRQASRQGLCRGSASARPGGGSCHESGCGGDFVDKSRCRRLRFPGNFLNLQIELSWLILSRPSRDLRAVPFSTGRTVRTTAGEGHKTAS